MLFRSVRAPGCFAIAARTLEERSIADPHLEQPQLVLETRSFDHISGSVQESIKGRARQLRNSVKT